MNIKAVIAVSILGLATLATGAPSPVLADSPLRLGLLTCQIDGSGGGLISSRRELSCILERPGTGQIERYAGEINRFGIDIGSTQYSDVSWIVFALTTTNPAPGALEGSYAGLSAGVSIGVGIGANALIGGLNRSIALQPLSLEASRGFNLALGIAQLELYSVGEFR